MFVEIARGEEPLMDADECGLIFCVGGGVGPDELEEIIRADGELAAGGLSTLGAAESSGNSSNARRDRRNGDMETSAKVCGGYRSLLRGT